MSSLNILVVGRPSEEEVVRVANEHTLTFVDSAKVSIMAEVSTPRAEDLTSSYDDVSGAIISEAPGKIYDCSSIRNIKEYDFVLQHTSNFETDEAIKCWEDLSQENKIIVFTLGAIPKKFSGFPGLAHIGGASTIINLRWNKVPSDFNGTSAQLVDLLRQQPTEILSALAILCQGYLAVHALYDGPNKDWTDKDLRSVLLQMGFWNEDGEIIVPLPPELENAITSELEEKITAVRSVSWWRIFGSEDLGEAIDKEWGTSQPDIRRKLDQLIEAISTGQVIKPDAVASAYCAIAKKLGGKPCQASTVT